MGRGGLRPLDLPDRHRPPVRCAKAVVVAAGLSWIVARLIIWALPNVSHWIEHLFVT